MLHYQNGTNTTPPIPYNQMIQGRNPLIYFRLDEPALPSALNLGLLGTGANGTYEPGALPGAAGVPFIGLGANNYGVQFPILTPPAYLDIPGTGLDLLGPVTVIAWVNAQPANGIFQSIVGKGDTSYRLDMDWNGYPRFADGDANPDVVGTTRIDDGQWHFLAGVYDGGSSNYLYLDGLLGASAPATSQVTGGASDVWIGGAPDYGNARSFSGVVDEVAIFPSALTAQQIQQIYGSAFNNAAPNPSASRNISIRMVNNQVRLSWCFGVLQSANEVGGPYNDLPGIVSPFTFTPAPARLFFRVKE